MIRTLRPGERTPTSAPRRYRSSHGYVRLRWRVGVGQYVETYEHRVVAGRVTIAAQVHHKNARRDDNRSENLARVSTAEHGEHHRRVDYAKAERMYRDGHTTVEIAGVLGCHPATLSRGLRRRGVAMRHGEDFARSVDIQTVRQMRENDARVPAIARAVGESESVVRRAMSASGIPSAPRGRPPSLLRGRV